GVKVRALADASTLWVSKQYLRDLREAGIQLLPYRPFMSIYTFHTLNYRNHRKIVVIDGQIGFVGGMNLDKEQLHNKSGFWRDTHLRIVGEAVQALQASFAVSWYNTTQEKIVDEINFPSPNLVDMPLTPVQVTFGGPDSQWRAMQQLYFMMIMSANKKVQIQSPFFIPDLSLLEAIKAAALSGIQVEIMCTKWGTGTDFPLPYYAANTYFADVVRAGARVFLYKKGYMHCKTIGIDEQVCAIGTANFDIRSFYLNYETMTVIYDDQLARELAGHFQEDLLECEEFLLEEYLERPVLSRLRDSICRLGSPIM
ncbi:MAG: cardiolipin synthase, partial [Chloroflexota bacterium]